MVCAVVGWQYGIGYFLFLIAEVNTVCVYICTCVYMGAYFVWCIYVLCVSVCVVYIYMYICVCMVEMY